MEADTVMNFILRFYHLEHVANRRHPALRGVIRSKLHSARKPLGVYSFSAATPPRALIHIVYTLFIRPR